MKTKPGGIQVILVSLQDILKAASNVQKIFGDSEHINGFCISDISSVSKTIVIKSAGGTVWTSKDLFKGKFMWIVVDGLLWQMSI